MAGSSAGGEDEAFSDAEKRDALLPKKTAAIARKAKQLFPQADFAADFAWTGSFGESPTGLPGHRTRAGIAALLCGAGLRRKRHYLQHARSPTRLAAYRANPGSRRGPVQTLTRLVPKDNFRYVKGSCAAIFRRNFPASSIAAFVIRLWRCQVFGEIFQRPAPALLH